MGRGLATKGSQEGGRAIYVFTLIYMMMRKQNVNCEKGDKRGGGVFCIVLTFSCYLFLVKQKEVK